MKKHRIWKSTKTESFGVRQISNLAPPSELFENIPAFYQLRVDFRAAKRVLAPRRCASRREESACAAKKVLAPRSSDFLTQKLPED